MEINYFININTDLNKQGKICQQKEIMNHQLYNCKNL